MSRGFEEDGTSEPRPCGHRAYLERHTSLSYADSRRWWDFALPSLRHDEGVKDERERNQLLQKEPWISLDPHEPPTGDMHENVEEIADGSLLCEKVCSREISQYKPDLQPLIDGCDTAKIV